jgi:hypothetical protein
MFFLTLNWGIFVINCVISQTIYDTKTLKNSYYVEIKYFHNIFPLIYCLNKCLKNLDFTRKKCLIFYDV